MFRTSVLVVAFLGGGVSVGAQQTLVDLDDFYPRELQSAAFELPTRTTLRIEAVGADERFRSSDFNIDMDYWRGNAWILDATSREVVWELQDERTDRGRDGTREFEGDIDLPAGRYIAHFASYSGFSWTLSDGVRWTRDGGAAERFLLRIEGAGRTIDLEEVITIPGDDPVISFRYVEDNENFEIGLRIDRRTEVEILAIGEAGERSTYDYGWLMNARTRELIWRLDHWRSDHAGGADKNRIARERVTLEPGDYVVGYVTDGSHDTYEWNAPPPYDPDYYGLTLRVDPSDRGNVRTFAYENLPGDDVIAQMIEMRDDDYASTGFSLSRPMNVRVYALGEGGRSHMHDYGWIIDADTRETVWRMEYFDTEHAGGASKNRLADEVLRLDAGNYVVYYTTDGSHSYGDWNSAPPMDQDNYGITLLGVDNFDRSAVSEYDDDDNPNVLARIEHVGDHAYRHDRFDLGEETRVRVYALGEGQGRRMFDYAWIEDERGRTVWRMRYRDTEHAGGARKNRMVNEVITLEAGRYTAYYESDGSHSFEDWNSDQPDDPEAWGVTVMRER